MNTKQFLAYLEKEKKASENTLLAYMHDINAFEKYLEGKKRKIEEATETDVMEYILDLGKEGRSRATTNRKLASLRAAYAFMIKKGIVKSDPTTGIKTPRAERKDLDYLTVSEIELILAAPDESIKGKRDKAILEVLYGTGIRVMELIELNYGDLNMQMGFIQCSGEHGKPRIVPLGSYAKEALSKYLEESRGALIKSEEKQIPPDAPLFLNYQGERFTRQGLWKLICTYGKKVGLSGRLTPHILRTSFAVHMIQNGADLKALQELLGYDDMQAMQVFMQVSTSKIKDVFDQTHPRA